MRIDKLKSVLDYVKSLYVGKDEIIDLLGISLIARENAFLFGPPGTAKSAIIKSLAQCIENGNNFEYLLTRFTEPNEIFGPFDIRKLKEGELVTNTEGMMPKASLVFLDEIFNANSAILNSLLMALNEKILRRGKEVLKLPALMFVGASNVLPEDESLNALLDRFLIRINCGYVDPDLLEQVLISGRNHEKASTVEVPTITPEEVIGIQTECKEIDLNEVRTTYVDLIHALRNIGVKVSDRRAVKCQGLIAASALISGREVANVSDLWILKYIWDTEEQVEVLTGLVNSFIEKEDHVDPHPQAISNVIPNSDKLFQELEQLKLNWESASLSPEQQNGIKDKLRFIQSQNKWIAKSEHKEHIQKEIDSLWQKMLQTV